MHRNNSRPSRWLDAEGQARPEYLAVVLGLASSCAFLLAEFAARSPVVVNALAGLLP